MTHSHRLTDDAKPVTQAEIEATATLAAVREQIHQNHARKGIVVAVDLVRRLAAERDRLYAELDPAVCRLQFPDGSVPGNAREAAEGWHKVACEAIVDRDRLRSLVVDFMDYEPCQYDHHGLCQAHTLHERPCPHEVAQKLFPKDKP